MSSYYDQYKQSQAPAGSDSYQQYKNDQNLVLNVQSAPDVQQHITSIQSSPLVNTPVAIPAKQSVKADETVQPSINVNPSGSKYYQDYQQSAGLGQSTSQAGNTLQPDAPQTSGSSYYNDYKKSLGDVTGVDNTPAPVIQKPIQTSGFSDLLQEGRDAPDDDNIADKYILGPVAKSPIGGLITGIGSALLTPVYDLTQKFYSDVELEHAQGKSASAILTDNSLTGGAAEEQQAIDLNQKGINPFLPVYTDVNGNPRTVLNDIPINNKTTAQITGDIAQAVMTVYAPEFADNLLAAGFGEQAAKETVIKTFLKASAQGAVNFGLPFGVAQALSSGTTDPAKFSGIVAKSIGLTAITAGALDTALPAFTKTTEYLKGIQSEVESNLVTKGYTPEQAHALATQGGFIGGTPEPEPSESSRTEGPEPIDTQLSETEAKPLSPEVQQVVSSYGDSVVPLKTFYNLDKLNLTPEGRAAGEEALNQASDNMEQIVGEPLTHKEVIQRASQTSAMLDETIGRDQTADSVALNYNLRTQIADMMNTGKVTPELMDLMAKDKAAGTDIARQLEARKIPAGTLESSNMKIIVDALKAKGNAVDDILQKAKDENVDFNNPKQAEDFYQSISPSTWKDWIDAVRYNSMLSSPKTSLIKTFTDISNSAILRPVTLATRGLVDAAQSAISGADRQYFAGESGAYIKGYARGVAEKWNGLVDAARNLKLSDFSPSNLYAKATNAGNDISEEGQAADLLGNNQNLPFTKSGTNARLAENILKVPTKILGNIEQFFRAIGTTAESAASDYRLANGGNVGDGFTGVPGGQTAAEQEVAANVKKTFYRGGNDFRRTGYFTDTLQTLNDSLREYKNSNNPVLKWTAKITLPFLDIGTQITKTMIEYSPLQLANMWGATDKTEAFSKFLIGLGSTAVAATLVGSDRITGQTPTNAALAAAFKDSGRKPFSVRIGNNWISYQKLPPPLAFNLALIASIKQAQQDARLNDNQSDAILQGLAEVGSSTAGFIADESYFKNIGDFVNATKGDVNGFTNFFANIPAQFVPFRALTGWVDGIIDPVSRQPNPSANFVTKQIQSIMEQIPGLSEKVPAELNAAGQPIVGAHPLLNAFSPTSIGLSDPAKEKAYEEQQELSTDTSIEDKNTQKDTIAAQQLFSTIGPMTPVQRGTYLKQNPPTPAVLDKLKTQIVDHAKQLDSFQQAFENAPDASKGKYLYDQYQTMDPTDRQELISQLQSKKLITPGVISSFMQQVNDHKNSGK